MRDERELRAQALQTRDDLESLRLSVEASALHPWVKSALTREITESQARVGRVLDACPTDPYAAPA